MNRAWCKKLGHTEAQARALTLDRTIHVEDLVRFRITFERLRAGESVGTLEARFVTRDGRPIVVEGDVSCSFREGKPALVRGIFRDVTERRQFEAVLEEYRRNLEQANRRLEELATTDPLTGLKNRLVLHERLEEEHRRAKRHGEPLALVLLDVDRFKSFNDSFGHPAGDDVLRCVAGLLKETARDTDVVVRFGGEEFAVLMPNTTRDGALALAERFRLSLELEPWGRRPVTASFGVAVCGEETADASALVSAADAALYLREAGRAESSGAVNGSRRIEGAFFRSGNASCPRYEALLRHAGLRSSASRPRPRRCVLRPPASRWRSGASQAGVTKQSFVTRASANEGECETAWFLTPDS